MPSYLYWRHKQTGEIYVVCVTDDGVLDGAYGPIPRKEARLAKLPHWPFTTAEGERLPWHRHEALSRQFYC